MDLNKRIFNVGLPILAMVAVGCGGGAKGGNIATVNGDAIGKDEFYKAMEMKNDATVVVNPQNLQSTGGQIPPQAYAGQLADGNIGFETLKQLVEQRIILQLAADQGVSPTSADVNKEIENQKRDNPDQLKQLTSHGYTLDFIRKSIEVGLAQEKLVTRGIKISDKDVDDYVKATPEDPLYYTPEGDLIQYIVAADAKAKTTIDQELGTGKQFALVAAQYTSDRGAAQRNYHLYGNGVDPAPVTQIEPKVLDIIKKLAEGQQSGWYPQGPGFVKFYLERRVKPQNKTVDPIIREKLVRKLALIEGSRGINLDKQKLEKLKSAKVVVTEEALKPYWDQYDKQLKSAATTPTASPSAAPSASPSAPAPSAPGK